MSEVRVIFSEVERWSTVAIGLCSAPFGIAVCFVYSLGPGFPLSGAGASARFPLIVKLLTKQIDLDLQGCGVCLGRSESIPPEDALIDVLPCRCNGGSWNGDN